MPAPNQRRGQSATRSLLLFADGSRPIISATLREEALPVTRRELMELAAKLGLVSMAPVAAACPAVEEPPSTWPPFEGCEPETVAWEWDGEAGPEGLFTHGVASGDPLPGGVILWTRAVADEAQDVEVFWEVATDASLSDVVASGITTAAASRDFTVKVDVACLRPATTYWYRFSAQGRTSPVGRTRTAAYGATEALKFAVCSCSNFPAGYFHGYRAIAEIDDLELVFHLGDYIYEYGGSGIRPHTPARELVSVDDYRERYAQYRSDPDLQAAHAAHPFVCVWDDHETANNSWSDGASNHNAGEGEWEDRKAAAHQALLEWLPVREPEQGLLYRRFVWGDLADFFVLDTRIEGRDEQSTTQEEAYDPDRQLLGESQEAWLLSGIEDTRSRWTVLAQQVVMAQWSVAADADGRPLPINRDAWDGYFHARQRVLEAIQVAERDLVVLTGDVHSSWANDLAMDFSAYNVVTHTGGVGVEAVAPGITSGGGAVELAQNLAVSTPHIRWADSLLRGFVVVDASHDGLSAEWHLLDDGTIESPSYAPPSVHARFVVHPGEPWWVED